MRLLILAATMSLLPVISASAGPAAGSEALSPRDLGARYGQALGASLACPGTRVTEKAEALSAGMRDEAREEFKRQAAVVVALWRKIPACDGATHGPNQCKLANNVSCREAYLDIGPEGRHLPGLIEWQR